MLEAEDTLELVAWAVVDELATTGEELELVLALVIELETDVIMVEWELDDWVLD